MQAFAEMSEQGVMIDASTCMTLLCVMHRARQWRLAEAAFLAAFGRAEPFAALQLPALPTHDLSPTVAVIVTRLQKLSRTGGGMRLPCFAHADCFNCTGPASRLTSRKHVA
jgi:hypothetical protein